MVHRILQSFKFRDHVTYYPCVLCSLKKQTLFLDFKWKRVVKMSKRKHAQISAYFFFSFIGIHSMQVWTATTRHWVIRKREISFVKISKWSQTSHFSIFFSYYFTWYFCCFYTISFCKCLDPLIQMQTAKW